MEKGRRAGLGGISECVAAFLYWTLICNNVCNALSVVVAPAVTTCSDKRYYERS